MKKLVKPVALVFIAASLAGCGNNKAQRALSGGGIGAAAGTVGAVVLSADPVTGALVGAAVGAATGALTDKDQIDFGPIK